METSKSINFDKAYNDQSNLLDGLFEFHPEHFDALSPQEFEIIKKYYLTGVVDIPDDVFSYRAELIKKDPSIEESASIIYKKILEVAGVK